MFKVWIINRSFKRLISEILHIKEQSHGLNSMNDIDLLDTSYFDLLNKMKHLFLLETIVYVSS